ncbi:MAG: hypothetical protein IJW91_01010, partial [Phascolarctobacterium sp.]|nr:hypothetical protein [Phascolarctobacterium sp.]
NCWQSWAVVGQKKIIVSIKSIKPVIVSRETITGFVFYFVFIKIFLQISRGFHNYPIKIQAKQIFYRIIVLTKGGGDGARIFLAGTHS